jgi:PUA domain protein
MPEKSKRYFLKAKESRTLLTEASEKLKTDLELLLKGKRTVETFKTESVEIFLIDGKPVLFKLDNDILPTLKFDEYFTLAPRVVVDMGAVPYVCKGANVMAPGLRRIEGQFDKDSIVSVVDEKHGKVIAVGQIIYDAEEVKNIRQGMVVKNVHYIGDGTWNLLKELASKVQ